MKKIFPYFNCLLFLLLAIGGVSCGPQDEVVDLPGDYELRRKPGEAYFAIYFSYDLGGGKKSAPEIKSEAIYEGVFEPLNITDLADSENMFILQSAGKKYLFDGRSGAMMLEGNPFIRYAKDNDGGLYFETEKGLYPLDRTEGLPTSVDRYYRAGGTFIYKRDGKWGVYQRVIKSGTNVFRAPVFRYLEILPVRFDKIRYVRGDGAHHFVARKDGRWQLYDGWGRIRHMCIGEFDKHRMNIYSPSAAGERSVSGGYISQIVSIPVDCKDKYIPYLMTRCTYTGDTEVGIIKLESHEDKYSSFFTTQDDHSTYDLPWDEIGINAEYHY